MDYSATARGARTRVDERGVLYEPVEHLARFQERREVRQASPSCHLRVLEPSYAEQTAKRDDG